MHPLKIHAFARRTRGHKTQKDKKRTDKKRRSKKRGLSSFSSSFSSVENGVVRLSDTEVKSPENWGVIVLAAEPG